MFNKALKKINLRLSYIHKDLLSKIEGQNTSLKELNIKYLDQDKLILFELEDKFPNLLNFSIECAHFLLNDEKEKEIIKELEIIENLNCKINDLTLNIGKNINIMRLYCTSFENLIKIDIRLEMCVKDLKKSFPIFSENCKIIFKNLISFTFFTYDFEIRFKYYK